MQTRTNLTWRGAWYEILFFDDPYRLPSGCIVRISDADFSWEEAAYLLARLRTGNNLTPLHFQRDTGIAVVTLPGGETVCVFVEIHFTPNVGKKEISIHLPPEPGRFNARYRLRTADRTIFPNIQNTSVIL